MGFVTGRETKVTEDRKVTTRTSSNRRGTYHRFQDEHELSDDD